jgi:hypothetical protein
VPFTRATTATRTNAAGLIELVPYNLLTYSEQFDNASWTTSNASVTANATTSPSGLVNADKLVVNNLLSAHFISQPVSVASAGSYTTSVYAKKGEYIGFRINYISTANAFVSVNLDTGVIASAGGTIYLGSTISNVGNGWYRITMTFNAPIGLNGLTFAIESPVGTILFTGDGTSGIYLWGAQLVEGTDALPYQLTETRLNRPRVDFSLGGCPSLLLEPQRTNLLTYSSSFDDSSWVKANFYGGTSPVITANYAISPDGTQNADRIQLTRTNDTLSYSYVYKTISVTIGQTYTWSVWLKSLSGTPSVALTSDGVNYTNIVTLTNEWERYEFTTTAAGTDLLATFLLFQNLPSTSLTADFLAYGFQLEQGSYATSLIPTTSASVTRNADQVYKTGISSLIGQTEGTIYLEADIQKHNESEFYVAISNGFSLGESIYLFQPSGGILQVLFRTGGVDQSISILNANWNIGYNKIAIAYNSTSGEVFMNGVSQGTVALSALPTCSQLTLGARPDISGNLVGSGGYKSSALFKTRLTNDQLEALTGEGFDTYALMASNYNYILQ